MKATDRGGTMPADPAEALTRARAALSELRVCLLAMGPDHSLVPAGARPAELVSAIYKASDTLDTLRGDFDDLARLLGVAP